MIEVPLSKGQQAVIDDEDQDLVMQYRWYAHRAPHTWYALSYRGLGKSARAVTMHRLIMGVADKDGKATEVDHIDGNGLNNTRANLRLATRAQNARNHKRSRNNTSGFTGVSWHAHTRTWCVQIRAHGQPIKVGYYREREDAARAYNEAARRYYGAFARLNDVPPAPPLLLLPAPPVPLLLAAPQPWRGTGAEEAVAQAHGLGHVLSAPAVLAGVQARQCERCFALVVARRDGSYGGKALVQRCRMPAESVRQDSALYLQMHRRRYGGRIFAMSAGKKT